MPSSYVLREIKPYSHGRVNTPRRRRTRTTAIRRAFYHPACGCAIIHAYGNETRQTRNRRRRRGRTLRRRCRGRSPHSLRSRRAQGPPRLKSADDRKRALQLHERPLARPVPARPRLLSVRRPHGALRRRSHTRLPAAPDHRRIQVARRSPATHARRAHVPRRRQGRDHSPRLRRPSARIGRAHPDELPRESRAGRASEQGRRTLRPGDGQLRPRRRKRSARDGRRQLSENRLGRRWTELRPRIRTHDHPLSSRTHRA